MERFNALGRGTQIMLVAGVLLFIDTFLPWQDFGIPDIAEALGVDDTPSAWRGFWGWILGLLTIVLLAWLVVRLAAVNIRIPVSSAMTAGLIGTLILFFAVVKNLNDAESTIWSYVGVGLAILVALGAWLQIQEAGGVEQLKSELPSMPAAAPPAAEPAPPPPTAAPPEPAPEASAKQRDADEEEVAGAEKDLE